MNIYEYYSKCLKMGDDESTYKRYLKDDLETIPASTLRSRQNKNIARAEVTRNLQNRLQVLTDSEESEVSQIKKIHLKYF